MKPFHLRIRPQSAWVGGNRIELLENGEQYYPAVFDAIAAARREVLIETFILFEDKVGLALKDVLIAAARRGVAIDLTIDGYGSPDLSPKFIADLAEAGIRLHVFDPRRRIFGLRTNLFRRMHRKLVVIDGRMAFVGGMNFSADHLQDYGPESKLDHAVRIAGPLVPRIRGFVRSQLPGPRRPLDDLDAPAPPAGTAQAMFVVRDNSRHRNDIERQYRAAIRSARREVIIANAYFFPGYRLLKALRQAARRGVRVVLMLQGQPDMPLVRWATNLLYSQLLGARIEIQEYGKQPMHSKVALVDDHWSTVGSSNLDPLSLSLNLEANVMIRDAAFNVVLRERLRALMCDDCTVVPEQRLARRPGWSVLLDTLAYHFTRHFPSLAGWLPAHTPRLASHEPGASAKVTETVLDDAVGTPQAARNDSRYDTVERAP